MAKFNYTVEEVVWFAEGPESLTSHTDIEEAFDECERLESLLTEDDDTYYHVVVNKIEGETE